ncbi:Na+/H+ antiporter subunit E [Thermaurantiacus sp.]
MSRLVPMPLMSLTVAGLWLVLASSFTRGSFLVAILLGILVPPLLQRFWIDLPRLHAPGVAIRFAATVLGDIIVANLEVARLVLGDPAKLRPAFVTVPLDIERPTVVTILASIVSLTPGTVSIDFADGELHLHTLDTADPAALVRRIKARYEAPLKVIFGC